MELILHYQSKYAVLTEVARACGHVAGVRNVTDGRVQTQVGAGAESFYS
jgi:hypothetical protein